MNYKSEDDLRKAGFLPAGECVRLFATTVSALAHLRFTRRVTVASVKINGSKITESHWYRKREIAQFYKRATGSMGVSIKITKAEQSRPIRAKKKTAKKKASKK